MRKKVSIPTVYPPAYTHTIPGQSLRPSELLKRHLAGTLPPIDLSSRYEFHYDEKGQQIAEPLPNELHEVHRLSVALRERQYEEQLEARKKAAEKRKQDIIDEYEREQAARKAKANPPIDATAPIPPKGDTPA